VIHLEPALKLAASGAGNPPAPSGISAARDLRDGLDRFRRDRCLVNSVARW